MSATQRRWRGWGVHVSALLLMLTVVILLHNPLISVLYLLWIVVFALHTRWLVRASARDAAKRNHHLDERPDKGGRDSL